MKYEAYLDGNDLADGWSSWTIASSCSGLTGSSLKFIGKVFAGTEGLCPRSPISLLMNLVCLLCMLPFASTISLLIHDDVHDLEHEYDRECVVLSGWKERTANIADTVSR